MSKEKIIGAKNAVLNTLMFYRQALMEENCPDINKEIANELGKNLSLSEKQIEFIKNTDEDYNPVDILDKIIIILKSIIKSGEINKEFLQTAIDNLSFLSENFLNYKPKNKK